MRANKRQLITAPLLAGVLLGGGYWAQLSVTADATDPSASISLFSNKAHADTRVPTTAADVTAADQGLTSTGWQERLTGMLSESVSTAPVWNTATAGQWQGAAPAAY